MRAAVMAGFSGKRVAVRINATGTAEQAADIDALADLALDAVVLPKVDAPIDLGPVRGLGLPVLAMIETPTAIYAARDIGADPAVAGLIAGLNDLAHELKLPDGMDRTAMSHAIQAIVLAARAAGVWAFDGVYNAIDNVAGFASQAAEGRRLGFDGKSLIHPSQVDPCNAAFLPDDTAVALARQIIAAFDEPENAAKGAIRVEGKMVERLHLHHAQRVLAAAD